MKQISITIVERHKVKVGFFTYQLLHNSTYNKSPPGTAGILKSENMNTYDKTH